MTTTNIDNPEAVEAVAAAPALEPKKSLFAAALATVQGAPKWVLMAVPAAVVALGGYGYMQHGDKLFGEKASTVAQAPMSPMAVGINGEPQGFVPVAYDPYYGHAYGSNYGHYGDAHGNGYGRGYGHGHGNGRARGNFSFNMGGDFDGNGSGWGNGAGNGYGHNRYNNGYYY